MGKQVYFYNSNNGDREYDANSMTDWLHPFFTTGVFNGNMQVKANGDMTVNVGTGYANINGKVIKLETEETLWIETASGTMNRIDNVVLRRDDINRDITVEVVKGVEATKPVAPSLERSDHIYEIKLAEIHVNMGAMKITQEHIRDTRMFSDMCGWVVQAVKEIDLSQLPAQFEEQFGAWFEEIKGQLSSDAAGNLQTQIMTERARINELVAQKGVESVDTLELDFTGVNTTCTRIRAISNGICAELYITNLKWQSNMIRTYDTIAQFPEKLLPLTQSKSGEITRQVIYDADDIQIALRDNRLQVYRKEGATPKNHTCMVSYALKNPVMAELSDLRIDINGESHKSAGDAVREQFLNLKENVDKNEAEMKNAISMIDSFEDEKYEVIDVFLRSTKVDASKTTSSVQVGHVIRRNDFMYPEYYGKVPGEYVHIQSVEKGDYLVLANGYSFIPESSKLNMLVTDKDYRVTRLVPFEDLNERRTYLVEEDGYLYISCGYGNATADTKLFSIKTQKKLNTPLVLDEYMAATYSEDSQYGDRALEAILEGRQILVKVPNKNGELIYTNFMPVFQYQLPNAGNDYLTLMYFKDGMAENLMNAMTTGSFDGAYGEINMKLSKTYATCPLEV